MRPMLLLWIVTAFACQPSKPRAEDELRETAKQLWSTCEAGSAATCLELDRKLDEWRARGGAMAVKLRNQYDRDRLHDRACDGGHGPSCYEVARKTPLRQRSGPLDQACSAGHALACKELGDWHMAGHYGDAHPERAAPAYARACELGEDSACNVKLD